MMKKIVTVATATLLMSTATFANDLKLLPVLSDGYTPSWGVAVLGGYEKTRDINGGGDYGVEVSLTCPLLQIPTNTIKQQISIVNSATDGLAKTSVELNPHVMFDLGNRFELGAGPSLGLVYASYASSHDVVFGAGVGASLTYNISSKYFAGVESRYQWTTDADFGSGNKVNLDNTRTIAKFGVHF